MAKREIQVCVTDLPQVAELIRALELALEERTTLLKVTELEVDAARAEITALGAALRLAMSKESVARAEITRLEKAIARSEKARNAANVRWEKRRARRTAKEERRTALADDQDRFWAKVDRTGPCWLWTTTTNSEGYGQISIDDRLTLPHRLVYEWLFGPIPDGLQIDHLCRVRNCVNPTHLEAVTLQENLRRGREARGA